MSTKRFRHHPRPARCPIGPLAALLLLAALQAQAQTQTEGTGTSGSSRKFFLTPSLSITETLTDNVRLSSTDRRSELITQISPGLSVRSDAGRVQGSLNYALNGLIYARESGSNTVQHALNASGKAMLVENFAYVDASASISQQLLSAFGPVSPGTGMLGGNQTRVATWTVTPYVTGRLGGFATYEARVSYSETDTGASSIGNASSTSASVRLGSASSLARLGWSIDATHQESDYTAGRRTKTDSVVGTLSYTPHYQWRLFARAGREFSNFTTVEQEGHTTYGGGVTWIPSPRTTLSASADRHYYGDSHSLRFEHRMARTAFSVSDVRSVSTNPLPFLTGVQTTAFELLYLSLTSRYPDPTERARQALLELQALGIDPRTPALVGFLTSAATQQRSQQASMSYLGLRTNYVLSVFQSWSNRVDTLSGASDPLAGGGQIRQRGISASASHRLTPVSTLTANATYSRTPGLGGGQGQDFSSLILSWSTPIAYRTNFSLSGRHVRADGATNSYHESALIATVAFQF